MRQALIVLVVSLLLSAPALTLAYNTPCSGKKGGVSHCENGRFICHDGTVSQSKKVCGDPGAKKRR